MKIQFIILWMQTHFWLLLLVLCLCALATIALFFMRRKYESAISLLFTMLFAVLALFVSPTDNSNGNETIQSPASSSPVINSTSSSEHNNDVELESVSSPDKTTGDSSQPTSNDTNNSSSPDLFHQFNDSNNMSRIDNCYGFSIAVRSMSVCLGQPDESDNRFLGVIEPNAPPVNIWLIDYESHSLVESCTIQFGETYTFSIPKDGKYYYEVSCPGYETFFPDQILLFTNTKSAEAGITPWGIEIKKIGTDFSSPFRVKVLNDVPQSALEAGILVWANYTGSNDGCSCLPLYVNDDSLLTLWKNVDGVDYYTPVDFRLLNGYSLHLQLSNGSQKIVTIDPNGSSQYEISFNDAGSQ